MDDLASLCQDKLFTFRLRELKDVLGRIGMTKQGKKQVLVDRIMSLLTSTDLQGFKSNGVGGKKFDVGREEVAKIIDDIFRKMKGCGANDLASSGQNVPKSQATVDEDDYEETCLLEAKTRCPCGSSMDRDIMIQCDDNKCRVWQHLACVVIPEKAGEDVQAEVPALFYCEACRINRADPFCVTVSQPVLPTKLRISFASGEGSSPIQNIEKTFILSRADRDLLQKPGYDLQAWCILLNDKVMFRMHWPQYADLRVNDAVVRVTNRPGLQLLGANGRDDGPGIMAYSGEGNNKISLSAYDARQFCLGVRVIKRQTVKQVLSLVPSETEGEPYEESIARVRHCIGGGGSLGNAEDSDSDLKVVADSVTVNLRCPMSGMRMNVAGRFKPCEHMGCFDLQTFVELNERTRKWQCPICLKNYALENIVIDQYFSRIASAMKCYHEDVTEVEIKPDGSWRPKCEGEPKYREQWHLPDGSFPTSNIDAESKPQISKQVKQDHTSEARMALKIGMKRNCDGLWEFNGTKDNQTSGHALNKNKKQKSTKFPQLSSATASNGDHEDPSVNQEGSANLDILVDNDVDFDSASLGPSQPLSTVVNHVDSQLQKDSKVIVLSDSEEEIEDELNIGSSTASAFAGSANLVQGGLNRLNSSENLPEESLVCHNSIPFVPSGSSTLNSVPYNADGPLDLFGVDAFEFNPTHWSAHAQNTPFQFGMDTSAPDSTANAQHTSIVRPTSAARYNTALQQQINRSSVSRIPDYTRSSDSPPNYLNTEVNGNPIENLSSIDNADASLQLFLSPQPTRSLVHDDLSEPVITSDTLQTNWISLSLGSGNISGTHTLGTFIAGRQHTADERSGLDSLANTALNMSNKGTCLGSLDNNGSDSPLCHQCPQSAHSRLCLPVASDSD